MPGVAAHTEWAEARVAKLAALQKVTQTLWHFHTQAQTLIGA